MTAALPTSAFKKNGTLHIRNCAAFYGVRPHTLRLWHRSGAPVLDPDAMVGWKEERNRVRLQKIGNKNNRHESKRAEIVRLYVVERLGLRAISRYFGSRPSTSGVREILIGCGVYRHGEAMAEQSAVSAARRNALVETEKEKRRRVATCLWRLRKGQPVETTCRENGWNPRNIWNLLGSSATYRRFRARKLRKWPDNRKYGMHYSRLFPKEAALHTRVEELLGAAEIEYVKECRLKECRSRVDFRTSDDTFIECKVGMNSGQTYEFIGQACHYRLFARRVILCVPSDIQIRADLHKLIVAQDVTVCNETTLFSCLTGAQMRIGPAQIAPAKKTTFVCKCCGSGERRRHRMNSYCVDCAPDIPKMRFDYHLNRWVANREATEGIGKRPEQATLP